MDNSHEDKKLSFYYRARKEYQNAEKPFTYQFNLRSTQNRPKKFLIIINKFIQIFKEGLKPNHSEETQDQNNYWNQLVLHFKNTYQMDFILQSIYDKKIMKIRQYFGLLIYNKKIFTTLQEIMQKMQYLYFDIQKKKKSYAQNIKLVDFLKDGQYNIMGQIISQFQKYSQQRKEFQLIQQKRKIQQEQKEKRQKQAYQRQLLEIKKKQQQIKRRQQLQEQKRRKKIEELKNNQTPYNNDDLPQVILPQQYRRRTSTKHQYRTQLPKQIKVQNKPINKSLKIKHSDQLYNERFAGQHQVFSFRLKPQTSIHKEKCFQCGKGLSVGLYIFGGNQNLCYYTGEWYCNDCIADQRISIPWKALQSFDLRGYPVSKKSLIQIKAYYEKPIIQIQNHDNIVQNNQKFYEFLVLRRQIHLMYDAICNLELMQMLLKKKLNYCLKMNLFSLKNLYDIYNGQEINTLMQYYDVLCRHFYKCPTCQKRKGYNCGKCNDSIKIFPFEVRQVTGCKICRKLYHRKCLTGECECTREQF